MKDLGRICLKLKNRMTCNQLQVIRFLSMHDNLLSWIKTSRKGTFFSFFWFVLKAIVVSRETFYRNSNPIGGISNEGNRFIMLIFLSPKILMPDARIKMPPTIESSVNSVVLMAVAQSLAKR